MQLSKLTSLLAACAWLSISACGESLTFVAQPNGSGLDTDWFNSANWFTTDLSGNLQPAGRVPLADESAIIVGTVDLEASGVRVQTLVLTNNATVTNGTMAVENLRLLSGCSINNSLVNVLTRALVQGTNCTLNAATLSVLGIGSAIIQPLNPTMESSLVLTQGAGLLIGGTLSLNGGAQISGGGLPQSKLVVEPGGVLTATDSAAIIGAATGHLLVDNSGLIRADGGILTFKDGIDWLCTAGTQEFAAAGPASTILFSSPFQGDAGVTSAFIGPGTNHWLAGASIDGIAQVAVLDPGTQLAGPGHLEISDSVTGAGSVHLLGTTNQGGVASWNNGTLGLQSLSIDPGAGLLIGGNPGTSRQLAACVISNLGSCTFWGTNLDFSQGAIFDNQTGAVFIVQADGVFSSSAGSGTFNNFGTFRKISAGISQFGNVNSAQGPGFNNAGLLDLQGGELNLLGGISSGEFRQTQGTVLRFWGGTHTLSSGASFTGSSSVQVLSSAPAVKWLVNGALSIAEMEVGANGTVEGSGTANVVQLHNLLIHDNAVITNVALQIQTLQMRDQSMLAQSTAGIESSLDVAGSNCSLAATTLNLGAGALGNLQPSSAGSITKLYLSQGSVFQNGGDLRLGDQTLIVGGSAPPSKLRVLRGARVLGTNSCAIQGSTAAPLTLDNNGDIGVEGGTLTFGDGLDWQSTSGAGQFQASAPGDLLLFNGPFRVASGVTSQFTGAGTSRWLLATVIEGIAQVGGSVTGPPLPGPGNLEILGPVNGAGSVHIYGVPAQAGKVSWISGTISLPHIEVDTGGTLLIGGQPGTTRELSSGGVNNAGSVVFIGGDLLLHQGTVINNFPGAIIGLQTNVALSVAAGSTASLNNAGTFLMAAPGTSIVAADFMNAGKLEVQTGLLRFQGAWTQAQGSTLIDTGAILSGTTLTVEGGAVSGTGTISATILNNGGTVSPGSGAGVLSIGPGQDYLQGPSGTLAIELGGTAPGTQYDQFTVGGDATLNGELALSLLNGFVPQAGQTFHLLSSGTPNGRFARITSPPISGMTWVARYTSVGVTLILAGNVSLGRPVFTGGGLSLPISTVPGLVYAVEGTDELNPPNWQTLKTITGDGTTKSFSDNAGPAHRFYRVVLE